MLNEVIVVHFDRHPFVLDYDEDNHYHNHSFDYYYRDMVDLVVDVDDEEFSKLKILYKNIEYKTRINLVGIYAL